MTIETQACPKCGEFVEYMGPFPWWLLFFGACVFSFIPFVGWLGGPPMALIGFVGGILTLGRPGINRRKSFDFTCEKCKKEFTLGREELAVTS